MQRKWQHTLHIGDIWQAATDRTITPQEAAERIAKRLENLKVGDHYNVDKMFVAEGFRDLAGDTTSNWSDFDEVMEDLYDWADTPVGEGWPMPKLCWVDRSI